MLYVGLFVFFKQKTAYEMRISDWSSDVCSSDLCLRALALSLDYARQRKQFGKPIADFQMVQSMLAEMYVWVESMRLYTYQVLRAANTVSEGESGRGDIHKLTAAGVMYTAETLTRSDEHTSELQSLMRISFAVISSKT